MHLYGMEVAADARGGWTKGRDYYKKIISGTRYLPYLSDHMMS